MKINSPELFNKLRDHGLRPTEARRLILTLLSENNHHPNTDGIIKALKEKGYPVSIATLYQNLDKLVEVGLLARIKGPDGIMRFDANLAPHHHLVCNSCGKMVDIRTHQQSQLDNAPLDFQSGHVLSDWHIDNIKIEYQGTCSSCQQG